jgi:hypothetical protein
MATVEPIATGRAFGNLTGQYPHMSNRGNTYLLIINDYDTNAIIAEPLKGRIKGDILNGYRNVHKQLARNGYRPTLQTLDKEASDILLQYMRNNKIDIQLALPHIHRRNLAERAIRTFKEHFKALRASCNPKIPHICGAALSPKPSCPSICSKKHAFIQNCLHIMHCGAHLTTTAPH